MSAVSQQEKEELKTLIDGSKTLTAQNREQLLQRIDLLPVERVKELIKVFSQEKEKFQLMEMKYQKEEAKLQTDFINTVKKFENKETNKALQQEEMIEHKKEEAGLKKMEKALMGEKKLEPVKPRTKKGKSVVVVKKEPTVTVKIVKPTKMSNPKTKPVIRTKAAKTLQTSEKKQKASMISIKPSVSSKAFGLRSKKYLSWIIAGLLLVFVVFYYFLVYKP